MSRRDRSISAATNSSVVDGTGRGQVLLERPRVDRPGVDGRFLIALGRLRLGRGSPGRAFRLQEPLGTEHGDDPPIAQHREHPCRGDDLERRARGLAGVQALDGERAVGGVDDPLDRLDHPTDESQVLAEQHVHGTESMLGDSLLQPGKIQGGHVRTLRRSTSPPTGRMSVRADRGHSYPD